MAFEAQQRFVANASHELRTPLTTMRATLDVAIAKPHVPPQMQALDTNLREDLDQADRLLESFLVLARAQHGELGELASVSLAQIAADALARRGKAIAQRQIELHTTLAPVRVNGSETLLTRMVENVIENAVRHNETHGFINITCDTKADTALLIVESGGQPLPPACRGAARRTVQATRPRAHRLTERTRARALDCCRGRHCARRQPRTERSPRGRAPGQDHPPGGSGAYHLRIRMRVLVVEDVPRLANTIAEGLRDQPIAVDVAYDGEEGAAKLNLNPYDVVVLDRDLPGIHGDTLCQMIADSDNPAMILMLTAAGAPDERVAGLLLGADDYLPKPFHFPELVVLRIGALARRNSPPQSRTLQAGGIELDPLTGTVTRDGRGIDLTTKERAVLEALLAASPGGLTAEKLLEQAWDENADPFTRTVQVTIHRLRGKLGEPPIIQTTPGIGYRITTPPAHEQS